MTGDEIIACADAALAQVENYRRRLENRVRGSKIRAYGNKTMRVDEVRALPPQCGGGGGLYYRGTILNKDGSPNKATNPFSVRVDEAEFLD